MIKTVADPDSNHFKVFVNGIEENGCVFADDKVGYAVCFEVERVSDQLHAFKRVGIYPTIKTGQVEFKEKEKLKVIRIEERDKKSQN